MLGPLVRLLMFQDAQIRKISHSSHASWGPEGMNWAQDRENQINLEIAW